MGDQQTAGKVLVLWVIWVAILVSASVIRFMMPAMEGYAVAGALLWLLLAVPVVVSMAIRWLILPKMQTHQSYLVPFIIGLAVSELVILFGLFLVASQADVFYVTSLFLILMYAPLDGKRLAA